MAFSFSDQFFGTKTMGDAKRCRCKLHSDLLGFDVWVSTNWERKNPGTPAEAYDVTATADSTWCSSHAGATELRTIAKAAWDAAPPNVNWDFFDPDNPQ